MKDVTQLFVVVVGGFLVIFIVAVFVLPIMATMEFFGIETSTGVTAGSTGLISALPFFLFLLTAGAVLKMVLSK